MQLLAQLDFSKIKIPTNNNGLIGNINSNNLTVGIIISEIFNIYIFYAAAIALLIYLMIGGFQFMFSRGDPKAMQAAQLKITNAIIGFIIIFLAYWIVRLIEQLFGLQSTSFLMPFVNN